MTQHAHPKYVDGCPRCDLSRDDTLAGLFPDYTLEEREKIALLVEVMMLDERLNTIEEGN